MHYIANRQWLRHSRWLIPFDYWPIPAVGWWSLCCHSNQSNLAHCYHGFSTTGTLDSCWSPADPWFYSVMYVTKTEKWDSGCMFEHEPVTAWSHLHWGLTRQRVFTAGHEDEGSESPLEKLVETSVRSLSSCCLRECAIMGESVALTD